MLYPRAETVMRKPTEQLWTAEQVANFCQVKPSVVKYWVQQGQIPFLRLGKFVRFDPREVSEWVAQKALEGNSLMQNKNLETIR